MLQTATTLRALNGSVRRSADRTTEIGGLVAGTAEVAGASGSAMEQVARSMTDINASSRRINEIIATIDGIAFQTNILALNAAVEAARAGEQGRGFAVVAGEVRTLSRRVTEAAAEVRTLVQDAGGRIENGARQVQNLAGTMGQLVAGVNSVQTLIQELSDAMAVQGHDLVEVTQSFMLLEHAGEQNAALVVQMASAAQSLSGQTETLTDLMRRFRTAA